MTRKSTPDDAPLKASRRQTALEQLAAHTSAAKRIDQVPFPVGFVRATHHAPPLARMITGGRGDVRLKLYLCLTMKATSRPYDIKNNPQPYRWAQLLALPDPRGAGQRRINRAFAWLEHDGQKLIRLEPKRGRTPVVHLLSAAGDGGQYVRPAEIKGDRYYPAVPLDLWRQGWILDLSAIELALLLVLLDLQSGLKAPSPAPWITPERHDSYHLSDDTWTRASRMLRERGLLSVGRVFAGDEVHPERMRNTYWIDKERLHRAP